MGRRITEGSGANARSLFYSSQWQVLEERIYGQAQFQYVWSPVYVDALVLRDRFLIAIPIEHVDAWTIQSLTAQSPVENWDAEALDAYYALTTDVTPIQRKERLYVQQDANWNVTALINTAGNVVERMAYDPYGAVKFFTPTWTEKANTNFSWQYLHQGARRDPAIGSYDKRGRVYNPDLMRTYQRDPLGLTPDTNPYRWEGNNPVNRLDPSGLWWSVADVVNHGPVGFIADTFLLNFVIISNTAVGTNYSHQPVNAFYCR